MRLDGIMSKIKAESTYYSPRSGTVQRRGYNCYQAPRGTRLTITFPISTSVQQLGESWNGDRQNLPEVDILHINVTQRQCIFLLNQVFEDADIFNLRNLNSENLIGVVTENKAIERKESRGIKSYDCLDLS